eukprot:scaffold3674_cov371-Prasinococcus_capsulatus_cf.AAC.7
MLVSSMTISNRHPVKVDGVLCPLSTPTLSSASASQAYDTDYAHLRKLCEHFSVTHPPHGARFFIADLNGGARFQWERNTEVQTYTFYKKAMDEEIQKPFASDHVPMHFVPKDWLDSMPGFVLSASHVAFLDSTDEDEEDKVNSLSKFFNRSEFITGASVDDDRFRVYSDWRMHEDSFCRFVIQCEPDHRPNRRTAAGKVLQWIIEVDKYRMLALMGLPFSLRLSPRIDDLNADLQEVMRSVSHAESEGSTDQRQLLQKLCALTATSLQLSQASEHRLAASSAYSEIIQDRLHFLKMEAIPGVPSMEAFLHNALHPAQRTWNAVEARLAAVTANSQITAELMRTSLTVDIQSKNYRELEQLQNTAKSQLLLQETVEGLSVVAITYYTVGVTGYLVKAIEGTLGVLPASPEVALGLAVPFIAIGVYVGLDRLKKGVLEHPKRA